MHSETGNQPKVEIIAYHGWGFNSWFWHKWEEFLPNYIHFKTADRGYFLEEERPGFSKNSHYKILFTHSFGLHWCSDETIQKATHIVIFNGFREFHPKENPARKRSKTILNKMITEFEMNPEKVLKSFWENTFYPSLSPGMPGKKFDHQLLLKDLKKLDHSVFELKGFDNAKQVISIDGGKDKILYSLKGKNLIGIKNEHKNHHIINEAGHGLPLKHFQDCWSYISTMIPIFEDYGDNRR